MQEVGKEIKRYTELNGRTDSNLIDALNAMYEYDMPKEKLIQHMRSKELTLASHTAGKEIIYVDIYIGFLGEYEGALNAKVSTKVEALQQTFSNTDAVNIPGNQPISEAIKKLKTFNTIPQHLHSAFPSHLEFAVDQTPVQVESNPSYDRIKKVQFKREIENSIQKVAQIGASDEKPPSSPPEIAGDTHMINTSTENVAATIVAIQQAPPVGDQFTGSGQVAKNNLDSLFF